MESTISEIKKTAEEMVESAILLHRKMPIALLSEAPRADVKKAVQLDEILYCRTCHKEVELSPDLATRAAFAMAEDVRIIRKIAVAFMAISIVGAVLWGLLWLTR